MQSIIPALKEDIHIIRLLAAKLCDFCFYLWPKHDRTEANVREIDFFLLKMAELSGFGMSEKNISDHKN